MVGTKSAIIYSHRMIIRLLFIVSSHTHVGVKVLSTHGNIYESTHAHCHGKIFTSSLLTFQTQVVLCGGEFSVPSCTLKHLVKKRAENVFLQSSELVGVRLDSTYQRRFSTKSLACGVEHVLLPFTRIRKISNCHINPRVHISHPHSTNYNIHSALNWSRATHSAVK